MKHYSIKIGILLFLLSLSTTILAQFEDISELKNVTTEMVEIIKDNSLYKDSLDWDLINNKLLNEIENLELIEGSKKIIDSVLHFLVSCGDNHSLYMSNSSYKDWVEPSTLEVLFPTSQLLENNVGYLNLPAHPYFSSELNFVYADTLRKQIEYLDEHANIKGWIVDLRQNNGGFMYPMIAGLNPLIEDGVVGYCILDEDATKLKSTSRRIQYGRKMKTKYKCKTLDTKIAVLIGGNTQSAGEMTAISLSGMKRSNIFGDTSGGLTSMPERFNLSNGAIFWLATSYFADRHKKIYTNKIIPNVIIDEKHILEEVIKWIEK